MALLSLRGVAPFRRMAGGCFQLTEDDVRDDFSFVAFRQCISLGQLHRKRGQPPHCHNRRKELTCHRHQQILAAIKH